MDPRVLLSWKPAFHVAVVDPDQVFLLTETRSFALTGRAYRHLAPLIDGTRTGEALVDAVADRIPLSEALQALRTLDERGYITSGEPPQDVAVAAFWHLRGLDPRAAAAAVAASSIHIRSFGRIDPLVSAAVARALDDAGVTRTEREAAADLVLVDDYLQDGLADHNGEAVRAKRPWLIAKPVGAVIWIGPLFHPGEGPCWACLADRVRGNRQLEGYLQGKARRTAPLPTSLGVLPATADLAAGLVADTVQQWMGRGRDDRLRETLVTIDLATLESRRHHVVRRPQCGVCGSPADAARDPSPVRPQSRRTVFAEDGGYRTVTPDETFDRLKHHLSPITGVISSLEKLTVGGNPVAHSYSAGHNFAMMSDSLFFLRQNLRGRSGGKGLSDMQARVSGMCEAIERYSGVVRGGEIVRRASLHEMADDAIHPNACMGFSDRQYEQRRAWNAVQPHTKFHIVPDPLDPSRAVDWTPVYSLTRDRVRWLPTALLYFGHTDLADHFFCLADSNGTAAGNTLEEAILQALLEVVERDAVAIWWYNRPLRPGIDLESFDLPYLTAVSAFYKSIGRDIRAIDITSDLGIPVVAGISRRLDRGVEDIIVGFGAHLDPALALLRAVTEVNQFLPAVSRTNADGSTAYWFHDPGAIEWWKTATVDANPHVAADPRVPMRTRSDLPALGCGDLKTDVERVVGLLAGAGLETFVLDQTRPDVGLPVARVIVPGMRHFWRRLGAGRLYDVPVAMGWRDRPTDEDAMNPVSIFF